MRVIVALVAALMLFTSLGVGGTAQASSSVGCLDAAVGAASFGHADCGITEAPADVHKTTPHHHGTCHSHHVAAPVDIAGTAFADRRDSVVIMGTIARLTATDGEITLKPPRA